MVENEGSLHGRCPHERLDERFSERHDESSDYSDERSNAYSASPAPPSDHPTWLSIQPTACRLQQRRLAQRYPDFPGLNLTYETREGMIKHETEYDSSDATGYEPEKRASLEAQIANYADEIAYNAHDLDDGLRAGLFSLDDLNELELEFHC